MRVRGGRIVRAAMPVVEFGPFRLDPEELLLSRGEEQVALTPKALQLLTVLVEARGAVVSKEELTRRLWPDVVTSPGNLHQCVSMARKALGPKPGGGEWVENVPRAGYRVVAEVRAPEAAPPRRRAPASRWLAAAEVAGAVLALVLVVSRRGAAPAAACATGEPSAVDGYRVTSWATGFPHWITGECQGVLGMAAAPDGSVI